MRLITLMLDQVRYFVALVLLNSASRVGGFTGRVLTCSPLLRCSLVTLQTVKMKQAK